VCNRTTPTQYALIKYVMMIAHYVFRIQFIFFGKKVRLKIIAWLIGKWEKWTWIPFFVYMKVRNIHECHWKSMATGLSKPLNHNEPLEFESDNKTAENPQWIFEKHWKYHNWVTPKRYKKIFPKIQIIIGFFGNKCSFQNWFWNLSSTSGLSQIWQTINAWKLPTTCVKDLIPSSLKLW
jgi:hypothetical protein